MRLAAHGLAARLPAGWEGSIGATGEDDRGPLQPAANGPASDGADRRVLPVAHFATFPLPPLRGDFGSNIVDTMGRSDAFIALVEYEAAEAGTALFAREGMPRRLDPRSFSAKQLQRTLAGQAGVQIFFTERGRAFCLYVVLGDGTDAHRLVRRVERVLATIEIGEPA